MWNHGMGEIHNRNNISKDEIQDEIHQMHDYFFLSIVRPCREMKGLAFTDELRVMHP